MVDRSTSPVLRATGLRYVYGSYVALRDVRAVAPGELVALIGRNGAGKSTLLRCLAGWRSATRGPRS